MQAAIQNMEDQISYSLDIDQLELKIINVRVQLSQTDEATYHEI